jgi:hypothetical protein
MSTVMLQDMFKIQAALGGSSGQGGFGMYRDQEEKPAAEEEAPDFGLAGKDPDCRTFLYDGVTTMKWLKSHHLLFA